MRRIALVVLFITGQSGWAESFRFHLLAEPHSLDAQVEDVGGGNYVLQNIYRGLFRYHSSRGLINEGAKDCQRSPQKLTCHLDPRHRWSNGIRIKAKDYVTSFQRIADPNTKSRHAGLILSLLNASKIGTGELPPDRLGVKALDDSTLEFTFAKEDPEFEFKLINPSLTPTPPSGIMDREHSPQMLFSGPYVISEWKPNHFIHLKADPAYALPANPARPNIEAVFVENDATALRLYESGKLNFLRRLTAENIPRYRASPEFIQVPMARFDYVGFGPQLEAHPDLRAALTEGVDFASFMRLFDTKGPPGCPSLPAQLLDRSECQKFAPEQAKTLAKKDQVAKLSLHFSLMGGDDISRAAEWFQGQWKKNLGVQVELNGEEQSGYLQHLRALPPPIFRKGISLERPTCLAAVELFTTGNPENYIRFNDSAYDAKVEKLRNAKSSEERKILCRKAIEVLLASHRLIPLGEMYFTLLAKQNFKGWDLNELNQLDLTDLQEK